MTRRAVFAYVAATILLALALILSIWTVLNSASKDDLDSITKRVIKIEKQQGEGVDAGSGNNNPSGQPGPPSGGPPAESPSSSL